MISLADILGPGWSASAVAAQGFELPTGDSPLAMAKERLDIYDLWKHYGFSEQPSQNSRSPFREDTSPSFSIFDGGRRFKDHATGESGGLVEFVALATGSTEQDACRELIEIARTGTTSKQLAPRRARIKREEEPRKPFRLPALDGGKISEMNQLARSRGFHLFAGLEILRQREQLGFYDSPQGRAWLVYDRAGKVAQARLLSGDKWPAPINAKAKTRPGSRASWPVGASTITPSTKFIYIVEGGPDLLAAATMAYLTAPSAIAQSAFVSMLGASQNIHEEARSLFAGKRIRIFADADEPGRASIKRWAGPLRDVEPESLTAWMSDEAGEDLNDYFLSANDTQLKLLTEI